MTITRILILAIAVLPAACVTPPPGPVLPAAPAWVSGPDPHYPDDRYLLARARANSITEAEDKARADVARPFVLHIESADPPDSNPGGPSTRRLVALSDRIIEQVQVVRRWPDLNNKTVHALAALPREVAADSLREQIATRDSDIRQTVEQSATAGDLLQRIRYLDSAVQRQVEREALHRLRTAVAPRAPVIETSWTVSRLRADRDALFGQARLLPQATTGSTPGLADAIGTAMTRSGLPASSDGQGEYLLVVRLVLEDGVAREGSVQQQGILELTLVERAGERVRSTRRWLIRAQAADRAGATRRALDETTNLLARNLRGLLLEAGRH
ncbi:MAG: hypothetical protein A2140_09365 [Candidatus Muproteobacteria bacterium RBG_16_62_13]|uniref:LPP20 lipoprotein n=1 Tax=Candidatus Muproteobacteria bacterium RBG_16_62_13 TaxID=1817756 RepID=A0A1F6T0F5_9PROT|nr:MAG: hypothetical protein A2140_09365 [Candidatus Muproteobacteria bacterium RBG_16_62_13]